MRTWRGGEGREVDILGEKRATLQSLEGTIKALASRRSLPVWGHADSGTIIGHAFSNLGLEHAQ